ncbi:LysM peptidoglycan-binding domain-containing protein [Flavobacterium sp. Fl-77]|uniref:LysM peptidoglycan-binding domain-containing protein n=1 Tax=Flavobacterium flavipigmentatum TaxID=2893884 RepID=A0AAJ2SDY4_9FLAO|nr:MULTISPECIES: LysM peptidoglycan-binding domain-containing protein [unclassified Flavobacterium]MDX6182724.1 LysM peptidoglycan-binding domain-containing protein [Flavobacterium sp. Fl-33]MDX6186097.1 LysM peptidoglycan-binding domain-containing protein [Flavobacterium sp. Fl-77]UFH38246.1 LysM peptidoglycan-binding domain-containing protein [Flavobacterium sp. F-70]
MSLQDKYKELTNLASSLEIANLNVREQDNVLYVDGTAKSAEDKEKLWNAYGTIDPDFRSADVVMNIAVTEGATTDYTVVSGDSLSKIGKKHGVSWQAIYEANKDVIKNPDLIQPGWKLKIPTA